ncbi:CWF19-like protein 2 [Dunckerocampus dactyliophorus]|uniref:CWF19-like protein 2 n=1 Tax=Dunckerocampus dactyliophorus TaxID=161453 RepID=UPI002405F7F6|nr:CWF19-like protein 2 [Dunckerocampus dactyliophorus]XP_054649294.1 CWF19-like protein 2 [Dunckerocampus dactyliophorus]XP_054649295.1 CWF19-like protein 2 [Dunckerocampus dactyliophorus]XP_054649296.1 CWF19-like protein 2 [Dunckerocampus dactyliophorus]
MAAHGVSFESTTNIANRKESKRQARQEALEKAKHQYEKEERRKELKRQRGEDTWMLPEVTDRLKEIEDEACVKSKKKKEKKSKKKKEKKKKAKKEKKATDAADGSSDSSDDSAEEWVEAQPQSQTPKAWKVLEKSKPPETYADSTQSVQRDEWMTFDFLAMKTTSTAERRAEKDRLKEEERAKAQAIEQAGLHKLELNPYWKDGGTGLPPEERAGTVTKKEGPVVNDGGLSWLRKSYQRMKEQAEREQRSLDEVVADRYGSMEEFQQRLAEAEKAVYGQRSRGEGGSMARGRWLEGKEERRETWRRKITERDQGRRSEREASPSARDRYSERGRYREGERDKPRQKDSERNSNKDRDRDRQRDRENQRDEERERSRDRERSSVASSAEQNWCQRSSSLGSLKGRFLKPSDDDDSSAPEHPPPASRSSSMRFLKPSSDDDSGPQTTISPTMNKCGSPGHQPDSLEQEAERGAAKLMAAPCDGKATKSSESDSQEEEEEEEEVVPILTEDEMNKLGAKLVKAEIMGNTAMVEKLKFQLEAARKAKENHAARMKLHQTAKSNLMAGRSSEDREVVLFRTDQSGQAWPVKPLSGPQEPHGGRRKKKPIETHVDGQRVRYFQDDDSVGLKEMVRREKMSSAQDQNALYSRMAAKMMGKTDGDNYTLDDMFVSSAAKREGEGREEERMRNRAAEESRRLTTTMEKCRHCFNSQELQKHLIIAIGSKVYLSLPAGVSMTEGHCLICPLQHHCAATSLDEDVWSEMQVFRRNLVRMFESQDLDCVFMEAHLNPRRRQHMVLECIPLPRELGDMAPIYFKKAIMECDEEWAMNKKVVDLSSKDIRKAVPRGLPYFAVDFGLQGGFAHVIENEQKFPHYFGKEVVGGMMDLEPRRWRKMIRENFDDQRKKVLQFAQWWKPYDCTKSGA